MRAFIFAIALLLAIPGRAQDKEEKLGWNEDRPLTWDDFKARPPGKNGFEANTNSGISYNWYYSTKGGKQVLKYEVSSNFYPKLSWVREMEEEDYLLAHEQSHFDITELHARKLRKALDDYEIGRNIRRDLNSLYDQIEEQREAMQKRFDAETDHSQNKEAEAQWRAFIAEELKKLDKYKC